MALHVNVINTPYVYLFPFLYKTEKQKTSEKSIRGNSSSGMAFYAWVSFEVRPFGYLTNLANMTRSDNHNSAGGRLSINFELPTNKKKNN